MLQAHNPNYLKASSPKNGGSDEGSKDAYDNIDEIPIAELSLDVPLKIHCKFLFNLFYVSITFHLFAAKKRSDKYLEESRKSQRKEKKAEKSKKSKKKSKKNKPELHSDSDSDEPKPLHVVNTTIEMPEGAVMSDTDLDKNDLDVNDPHRALDIDLDAADDFYAPRPTKAAKKTVEQEPVAKSSHRKKKEPEPVLLMESDENRKKDKKKHKRKKESPEVNLLETEEIDSTNKKEKKSKKKSKDDEKPKKQKKSSSKKSEYEEAFGEVM